MSMRKKGGEGEVQLIVRDGEPEYAVVPYRLYQRLREKAEMLDDVADYDEAVRAVEEGEELVPDAVVARLVAGESPVRVWREHRGLTQAELARRAGLSQAYIAQIERGTRIGGLAAYRALARALDVDVDDLLPGGGGTGS